MFGDPDRGDRINSFALVSYIPDPLAEFLNRLRQDLVPNCFLRAHITVLPPRPIRGSIEQARDCLCSLIPRFEAFEVELTGVEIFRKTDVIHIAVGRGDEQLRRMHDATNVNGLKFQEVYPYHPHVTLAQNLKPDELDELIQVARQRWEDTTHPRSFRVETLSFVQGTKDKKEWADLHHCDLAEEGGPVTKPAA